MATSGIQAILIFFTYEDTQKVRDIEANPLVSLNYAGEKGLFIAIRGKARIIHRRSMFEEHWQEELKQWFKEGIDTEGMVMIHVKGRTVLYWQREQQGEISL